jgi:sulfur relay (sulfurtransferase) complex TusBCD TusD component (DsrE family)
MSNPESINLERVNKLLILKDKEIARLNSLVDQLSLYTCVTCEKVRGIVKDYLEQISWADSEIIKNAKYKSCVVQLDKLINPKEGTRDAD